jgi:sec-independent protein translocase protein TatB
MSLAGWVEILFISLLAFVIIGPKDLPKVLFILGRFVQSLRRLSDEFMSEFETIHHLGEIEEEKKKRQNRSDN